MNEHSKISAELARRIQDDQWAKSLGIEYLELRRGYCRVALADAAFGAACNSHGAPAVALSMTSGFLATPQLDGRLIAECRERRQGRRAGFYEVTVTDATGAFVAVLQCVAHRVAPET